MPYKYDALEPHLDARTMEIHHTKHHQAYTTKLNAALEKCPSEIQSKDILEILADINSVPDDVRGAVNFNGGGFDNHRLFWNSMKSNGGGSPGGAIADAINASFGSFDAFKEKFSATTAVMAADGDGSIQQFFQSRIPPTSPRTFARMRSAFKMWFCGVFPLYVHHTCMAFQVVCMLSCMCYLSCLFIKYTVILQIQKI